MHQAAHKSRSIFLALWVILALCPTLLSGNDQIPENLDTPLRAGLATDQKTSMTAQKMRQDGWHYHMPKPKGPGASWDNYDKQTVWESGYWENKTTGQTSLSIPKPSGESFIGDDMGSRDTRRGGSPRKRPTELQWLLSEEGGIKP